MNTDWAKAILYVYPMMKELAAAARVAAKNKAVLSYRSKRDAMQDLEAVAEEMLLAERLEELKRLVDVLLMRLSHEELVLLEYRYFRRRRVLAEIGQVVNCSQRSYFRRQERLLKKVVAFLIKRGIDEAYFLAAFKHSICLTKVHRAIARGAEQRVCARRERQEIIFQGSRFSGGAVRLPRATKMATTSTATAESVIRTIWTADNGDLFAKVAGESLGGR